VADSRTDVDSERQAEAAVTAENSAKMRGGTREDSSAKDDKSSKTTQDIKVAFRKI
jgi:hypothetical protein